MKKSKAARPDAIVTEMLASLEYFGTKKLSTIVNNIYISGKIPDDFSKSIFIAIPKVTGTIACKLHCTISSMSHITKFLPNIIMEESETSLKLILNKTNAIL